MKRSPGVAKIGLLIANQADQSLLAELLEQAGYGFTLLAARDLTQRHASESLLIVDEASAHLHGAALSALKQQMQPLYFPMLLALKGNASATPWLRAGFDDVLRLPLNKDDVPARLEAFLRLRQESEEVHSESMRRFRATFDLAPVGIVHMTAGGQLFLANPQFCDMLGYAEDELSALTIRHLAHPDDAGDIQAAIDSLLAGQETVAHRFDMRYCRKDGNLIWTSVAIASVRDDDGHPKHLIAAVEDITRRKQMEKELLYLAHYDSLTGLPNRALLHDRLRQAIAHANRHAHLVWVLFLDLDRFKFVNDTLGHKAGDTLLQMISRRLREAIRETDTVARFGGDEFIMILSEPADENLAMSILKRVMSAVAQPLIIEGQEFILTCSLGVAVYPNDGQDSETLVDHADIAMYRAKELGRDNYQFYTAAMNESVLNRMQLERHLRNALERDEFVLHYQPQVDLCTGNIVGMEALIRWQHPELGMVSPASFIGLAEDTGLIVPIGAWVIRTACVQNKAWQEAGLGGLRISVNLSARQFAQQDLVQSIAAILQETGLEPRYLDIELTESIVMSDVEQTINILRGLKSIGAKLSIDDFGTGYSSLSYLSRFPIDVLKIDQSFVRDLMHNSGNAAISNAIISMAHSLGIEVIAEGVETEAQCDFLSRNMCDQIQGFWFSKPLPANDIEALLREKRHLPPHLLRIHKPPRTLLLVDDEPNIVSALKRLLRADDYQILTANGGQEGLDVLAQNKVDVILSDQRMPGMTGVEFLRSAKQLYPETVRIVLSGFTELQSVTDAINEGSIYRFLLKPWDDRQLRRHLEEAFQHKEMADENRRLNLEVRTANKELAATNRQLEEALKQKQEQVALSEATLAIMRETIHHSPLPIIGVDDDYVITFANAAAHGLFVNVASMLGADLHTALPELYIAASSIAEGSGCVAQIEGQPYHITWRKMGERSRSLGKLITLSKSDMTLQVP